MSFFLLAKSFERLLLWIGAVFVSMFAIFSRVYLGAHYPHDTLAGVICGIILVIAFTFVEKFFENEFSSEAHVTPKPKRNKVKDFLADKFNQVSVAMVVAAFAFSFLLDEVQRQRQQGLIFAPFCLLGVILARPFFLQFDCMSVRNRVLRFIAGVPLILFMYLLYLVSAQVFRPFLSVSVGFFIFAVAPYVFMKLKLT